MKRSVSYRVCPDTNISIQVEINDALQRTIKENCNTLHFNNAEFEK